MWKQARVRRAVYYLLNEQQENIQRNFLIVSNGLDSQYLPLQVCFYSFLITNIFFHIRTKELVNCGHTNCLLYYIQDAFVSFSSLLHVRLDYEGTIICFIVHKAVCVHCCCLATF